MFIIIGSHFMTIYYPHYFQITLYKTEELLGMNIVSAEDLSEWRWSKISSERKIGDRDKQEGNHGSSKAIKVINSNPSASTHYCHSLKKNMFGVPCQTIYPFCIPWMDVVFFWAALVTFCSGPKERKGEEIMRIIKERHKCNDSTSRGG